MQVEFGCVFFWDNPNLDYFPNPKTDLAFFLANPKTDHESISNPIRIGVLLILINLLVSIIPCSSSIKIIGRLYLIKPLLVMFFVR